MPAKARPIEKVEFGQGLKTPRQELMAAMIAKTIFIIDALKIDQPDGAKLPYKASLLAIATYGGRRRVSPYVGMMVAWHIKENPPRARMNKENTAFIDRQKQKYAKQIDKVASLTDDVPSLLQKARDDVRLIRQIEDENLRY